MTFNAHGVSATSRTNSSAKLIMPECLQVALAIPWHTSCWHVSFQTLAGQCSLHLLGVQGTHQPAPTFGPGIRPPPRVHDQSGGLFPHAVQQIPSRRFCESVCQPARQVWTRDSGPPTGSLGAVGVDSDATRPTIRYLSHQQFSYWATHAGDPWVVASSW